MKIEVVGKNGFKPSEANQVYAEKKLSKLERLLPEYDSLQARVVCKIYPSYHKVEITIPVKNMILRAEVKEEHLNGAIDAAVDKIVTQVKRYNDKVKDKMGKTSIRKSEEASDEQVFQKEKHIKLEPMTNDEALDQMELLGHDFFVYLDKETKKTNVIYLREDGEYAIIETE